MSSAVGGRNSRLSAPLIGSIAVLIVLITTFLAYNSNKGLPWVPSEKLTIEVKNAANIVPGNEVRIGGTRVGVVQSEEPKRYPDGRITALLNLKLDQGTQQLPRDTTIEIRARSLLGLKYVQLTPGDSKETFAWGSRVPLVNATPDPVEIDQLLNTFNKPTREGLVTTITEFGNALAGRGSVVGELLDSAGSLTDRIVPVAKVLANEQEGLVPFITALGRFTGELAAAGDSTGGLFRALDRTTGALAAADQSLDQTLRTAPDAFTSSAASLRATRPAVAPHIQFAADLQPSFDNLARGASDLAAASRAGVRGLPEVPRFASDFSSVLDQLDVLGKSAVVARGLDGLTQFSASSQPLVESLSRTQRVCSYLSILFRNIASTTTDGDSLGNWVRAAAYLPPYVPNGEGGPATAPANNANPPAGAYGYSSDRKRSVGVLQTSAALFSNPLPKNGVGGRCESGYEFRQPAAVALASTAAPQGVTIGNPSLQGAKTFRPAPPAGSPFAPKPTTPETGDEG